MHNLLLSFVPYFFQADIEDFRYEIAYTLMCKWTPFIPDALLKVSRQLKRL